VAQYVQLRDIIKKEDDEHKEKMRPKRELLEKLNSSLLNAVNAAGAESVRTAAGTVYKTEKKSASIADMDAFWTFVVATADWDLIDRKANVTAVVDHLEKNKQLPPGVNLNRTYVVGVMRA
jgi:hypothetical protein